MTTAIAAAVCSAFVSKSKTLDCVDTPQYYLVGYNTYIYAGEFGYDFDCNYDPSSTCTYYKWDPFLHPDSYATCHLGDFVKLTTTIAPRKAK